MTSNIPPELLKLGNMEGNPRNARDIHCKKCPCKILLAEKAELISKRMDLPHMTVKAKPAPGDPTESECVTDYWLVRDMLTFENVGFSNTVDGIKYLLCADCELGPIGWCHDSDRNVLYIAHNRVTYQ